MMVVRIVEDQAIANPDEPPTEGVDEVILGKHLVRCADGDGVFVDEQNLITDTGVIEVVGRDDHRSVGLEFVVDDIENQAA